jgi:tellurite resistance protein
MTDQELIADLKLLGVDSDSYRVVVLLPLIQVAWADGEIQASEREFIMRVAHGYGLLEGKSGAVLESWLTRTPSPEQVSRGRTLLVALTLRHRGMGSELGPQTLSDIEALCVDVARAAGGLFDTFFTVDDNERKALEEISRELASQREVFLDDLPSPIGGSYEDL